MISERKKFLFIHVPKTGGNSLQNILQKYSEDEIAILDKHQDGIERFEIRNENYKISKHSTLSRYKTVMEKSKFNSFFKFATIRNPWDMMVSFYFSPHRGVTEWNEAEFKNLIYKTQPLRHYIYVPSILERCFKKFHLPLSDSKLLRDIDYLLRFEHLESDFQMVCKQLDIPFKNLPKRNASSKGHYSKYYNAELKELVAKRFSEEIEIGKYKFRES